LREGGQPLVSAHPAGCAASAPPATALQGVVALLAGPEGGFSPEEDEWVLKRSLGLVSLGPHIVRAETAIIALTGTIQALKSSIE
jgi:RsmE family RNA methyltransferase